MPGVGVYDVRKAEPADLPLLAAVEAAADQLFIDRFQPETWDEPSTGEWRAAQPGFSIVEQPTGVLAEHLHHERALEKYDPRVGMVRRLVTDVR